MQASRILLAEFVRVDIDLDEVVYHGADHVIDGVAETVNAYVRTVDNDFDPVLLEVNGSKHPVQG